MKEKFVIAGERFATKKAVEERVRSLMHETPPYTCIAGQDERFIKAFFALHPNIQKVANLKEVWAVPGYTGQGNRFEIVRDDGTRTDISYKKPLMTLTGLDSHRADVFLAMRAAIKEQIDLFRWKETFGFYEEDLVVDHEYPWTFSRLINDFFAEEGLTFGQVKLCSADNDFGKWLDDGLDRKWGDYHREHARLRMLPANVNSSYGNRNPEEMNRDGAA